MTDEKKLPVLFVVASPGGCFDLYISRRGAERNSDGTTRVFEPYIPARAVRELREWIQREQFSWQHDECSPGYTCEKIKAEIDKLLAGTEAQ